MFSLVFTTWSNNSWSNNSAQFVQPAVSRRLGPSTFPWLSFWYTWQIEADSCDRVALASRSNVHLTSSFAVCRNLVLAAKIVRERLANNGTSHLWSSLHQWSSLHLWSSLAICGNEHVVKLLQRAVRACWAATRSCNAKPSLLHEEPKADGATFCSITSMGSSFLCYIVYLTWRFMLTCFLYARAQELLSQHFCVH